MSEELVAPVDAAQVERRLADREIAWPAPHVLVSTGSTNADALALAREGAPEGTVVVADEQTAGRGRLGREWVSAPGSGLWCSVLVRMPTTAGRGLLPLLAGVAVAEAVRRHGVQASLKWPNDVVVDGPALDGSAGPRKLAGILAESDGDEVVVIGIGVNVNQRAEQLPVPVATSLVLEGAVVSRNELLVDILTGLHAGLVGLRRDGAGFALDAYRSLCLTIGRDVVVSLPSGEIVSGRAVGVGDDGQLHVRTAEKTMSVAAGDVIHATI
ncbi:MAG: biotin--[acetyl-CoA-carboxylase] ligase [Actinobacteria bacterium]|nr:biotin--[acetyl-CoA-carboxylase] ligase [Actinomycetota bacterium]